MTTYFIARHQGALAWATEQGIADTVQVSHWTPEHTAALRPGDTVIGVLPIHIAADVCARGAAYASLDLPHLPPELRGVDLTAEQMTACGACLAYYHLARFPVPIAWRGFGSLLYGDRGHILHVGASLLLRDGTTSRVLDCRRTEDDLLVIEQAVMSGRAGWRETLDVYRSDGRVLHRCQIDGELALHDRDITAYVPWHVGG